MNRFFLSILSFSAGLLAVWLIPCHRDGSLEYWTMINQLDIATNFSPSIISKSLTLGTKHDDHFMCRRSVHPFGMSPLLETTVFFISMYLLIFAIEFRDSNSLPILLSCVLYPSLIKHFASLCQYLQFSMLCCCSVAKSCLTLCDPMDCSPPGSSFHGIFQARIWSGLSFSSPGNHPRIKLMSPASQVDSLAPGYLESPIQCYDHFVNQIYCWLIPNSFFESYDNIAASGVLN